MTLGWVKYRHEVFKGWDQARANENFPKHEGGAIVLDAVGYCGQYSMDQAEDQNSAEFPSRWARRRAISGLRARRSRNSSLTSRSISPGCVGRPRRLVVLGILMLHTSVSEPRMTAVDARRGVHTLQAAAVGARPAPLFKRNECLDAFIADDPQILKHAHPILHAIPGVEPLEPGTWEPPAIGAAESGLARLEDLAVADRARKARLGLAFVSRPTSEAPVLVPDVGHAEATIHAARCDQTWHQHVRQQLLSGLDPEWHWLASYRPNGQPLSRAALRRRSEATC